MKKLRRFLVRLIALGLLAHVWCCAQFHKEDWEVCSERLPAAFDGFRISLLTDMHGATFGKDSGKLLQAVTASEPDIIAISGDVVDRFSGHPEALRPMLQGLCEIAPTYYVTGNHEWDRNDTAALLAMIRECGVTVLDGRWELLEKDGQSVVLAGVEDPNGHADRVTPEVLLNAIRGEGAQDPYTVILSHRNNRLKMWAELGADLVLSGHGHGGVVRIPFVGGLLGVERNLFPTDCEGLLTRGRTTVAVSRGLGGVRIWNRPHIPTVVLKCVNNS